MSEEKPAKWKTVSMSVGKPFPLTGSELKEVCEHIAIVEMLIYDRPKFEQWVGLNPRLAANLDKLLDYSRAKNPQYVVEVIPDEQSTEETTG